MTLFNVFSRKLLQNVSNFAKYRSNFERRTFWVWINVIFNSVDEDRRARFGPDRTCAEWLLRNGAKVKWKGTSTFLADYNSLPIEGTLNLIEDIDASGSSIMHHGFPHFKGCKHIRKIILHDCCYLENEALPLLKPLINTLTYLKVSECGNITADGLQHLSILQNLQTLHLHNLHYVKDINGVVKNLKEQLPNCNILSQ